MDVYELKILEDGQVMVKRVTDETLVHRDIRHPGTDITDLPLEIQNTINDVWTQEVIDAYLASLPEPEIIIPPTYREMRAKEYEKLSEEETFYTSTGDFLDAIVDFLATEFPAALEHPKLGGLIAAVQKIKTDIPKD